MVIKSFAFIEDPQCHTLGVMWHPLLIEWKSVKILKCSSLQTLVIGSRDRLEVLVAAENINFIRMS